MVCIISLWFLFSLKLDKSVILIYYLLTSLPPRSAFKKKVKSAVTSYWEDVFRSEASSLPSLHLFVPLNCNLCQPHPLWTSAGSNNFECHKTVVLARMISGRYRTEYLSRHWTSNNLGHCHLATCVGVVGDLEHLLVTCPGLATVRSRMWDMILTRKEILIPLKNLPLRRLLICVTYMDKPC